MSGIDKRSITRILDDLDEVEKNLPRIKIGEGLFRTTYLPKFWYYQMANGETGKRVDVNLADWIFNVANGYFNEVDVISDRTGEVLFTVPRLIDRMGESVGGVNYGMGAGAEVAVAAGGLVAKTARQMIAGQQIIRAGRDLIDMANIYTSGLSKEERAEHRAAYLERWAKIFERYVPNYRNMTKQAVTQAMGGSDFEEEDESLI